MPKSNIRPRDSTVGGEKPLGERGAVMADTVGAKQS
jgi:hypothetical protein